MKLYKHQAEFEALNPDKALLVWEAGTGKTVGACVWLRQGRDTNALVICPKRIVQKWETELKKWGAKATVISKEKFKKNPGKNWSAIVVDEADEFASPLFTKQRSQLSTVLYNIVMTNQDTPILLMSATPIRSTPWNLHSLLCFMGNYIDRKKWQERFFQLTSRPYLKFPAWLVKDGWQKDIRPVLEKYAHIVLLKDIVDELPQVEEDIITTKPKGKFIKDIDWVEPGKVFVEQHKWEQNDKLRHILEVSKGYRKVAVVAHYVEQVEELNKQLSKHRQTFCVHGSVKGQEQKLQEANEVDECFLVIQASLGVGFDLDTFSCTIFVSMSYKVRDYVQMKARTKRIHNLHDIKYVYMLGGKSDRMVYNCIMKGKDFVPSEYATITQD